MRCLPRAALPRPLHAGDLRPFERDEAPTRLGAQGTTAIGSTVRGPSLMYAHEGDRLVVPSEQPGGPAREAEILGFRKGDGSPPFHVRWSDTGHEGLCFPGPSAFVIHLGQSGAEN